MGDDITIGVTEIVNNIEVTAQPNDQIVDISVIDNADEVTLNITPTVIEINVNKGSSYAKWGTILGTLSDQEDLQDALDLKANLVDGKVPASELPSYVDDVIEVADYASLPVTGEIGKIYITLDNNKIYRWSGSIYIEIASNNAIWGAITGTLSNQLDLQAALNLKANDADVVKLTGDQTITGTKSFNSSTSIGIRQNNSGNGYGIYSENASNGFGYYVANNGSGKAISVANALGSFGNMYEGSYNGTTNFYVNSQGGGYFSSYLTLDSSIFLKQDSNIGFSNGYTTIDTDSGGLYVGLNSSKLAYFNLNNITTQRNFTFPNLNGTFALGSGTTNYLAKWSNGNTIANSLIFDNGTNVGIGTTSPSALLHLATSSGNGSAMRFESTSTNGRTYGIGSNFATGVGEFAIYDYTANAERMRITSGGNVVINNLGTGIVYSNGGALTSTNPSDERLKDDISDLQYGLNEILQLRPVSYNWKNDTINQGKQFGFIAQEVQEIMPELISEFTTTEDEKEVVRLGLDKEGIYATLVNAIKELKAEIELLKQK